MDPKPVIFSLVPYMIWLSGGREAGFRVKGNNGKDMTVPDIGKNINKQINMKAYEVQQIGGAMNQN